MDKKYTKHRIPGKLSKCKTVKHRPTNLMLSIRKKSKGDAVEDASVTLMFDVQYLLTTCVYLMVEM